MLHPDYLYCPRCRTELTVIPHAGRDRNVCPSCHFTHWNNPMPVVAALLQVGDMMLLARNAAWPPKTFALITGFMEAGETPEQAVAREVKEETDLDAEQIELIGVYEFMRKNELIIAYHVVATGAVQLSEELAEYRMVKPEDLKPWRAGTGQAVAKWMSDRNLPFEWAERPGRAPRSENS